MVEKDCDTYLNVYDWSNEVTIYNSTWYRMVDVDQVLVLVWKKIFLLTYETSNVILLWSAAFSAQSVCHSKKLECEKNWDLRKNTWNHGLGAAEGPRLENLEIYLYGDGCILYFNVTLDWALAFLGTCL